MLNETYNDIDYEWIQLILEAIEIGISEEEIRVFLSNRHEGEILN